MDTQGDKQNPARPSSGPGRRPPRARPADDADRDEVASLAREIVGLRAAMETRATIARAQGMLMARHNLSADAAFALMVRLSQHSNTKMRELAARIVETAPADLG